MTGLPTTQVLLDDGTGTFPFDITNKTKLTEGFTFSRGREDTQEQPTAGVLNLTLLNGDGRFTPGSTVLASPSPIKVDQKIRIRETINGTTYTRYTGHVKSWTVGWPGVVEASSIVRVTASDTLARAERRVLRSVIEEEMLEDSPAFLYTLGEPAGATAAGDTSGSQQPSIAVTGTGAAVVFGTATGPGTDSLTAATFANGQYLSNPAVAEATTLEAAIVTSAAGGVIAAYGDSTLGLVIGVNASGFLYASTGVSLGLTATYTGATVTDGALHVVAADSTSGVSGFVDLYLDGVLVATSGTGFVAFSIVSQLAVGQGFTGSIAHISGYLGVSAPSPTRLAAHSTAARTGFAGESGTARITRTAGYANLPVGTLDTSLTNVAFTDITGRSVGDVLREVADAEVGLLFADGSGNATFHNRFRSPAKSSPDLTLAASLVSFNAEPTTDDADLKNYLEVSAASTEVAQVVRNTASETLHGRYSDSVTYLVQTDQEALDRGNWIVSNYAEPTTRYGTLAINLYAMTPAQASSALAALEPSCWLRVTNMPTQNTGGTTVDVVVEGFSEQQTDSSWTLTCNVVARSLFQAWILGDATYGVLDSTTRLGV